MSAEIRFEVSPDKEDYRSEAMHNIWRDSFVTYLLLGGSMGAGAAFAGGLQAGIINGAFMGLIAPISLYISQASAAAGRAKLADAMRPTTYVFSDTSLTIAAPEKVTLSAWSDWSQAIETSRVIALRPVGGFVQVFPKRQLTADVIAQLKAFLPRVLNGRVKFRGEE